MKVQSKEKILLVNDREGILKEKIQIEIVVYAKDSVNKTYTFQTVDSILYEDGSTLVYCGKSGQPQIKYYYKTYEEYDAQKEVLSKMFPSELTGSELDDYLLQMGLLYNLSIDPIYEVNGEQWIPSENKHSSEF